MSSTTTLEVQGMTCAACVGRVERALSKVPGVEKATVNLATERATIKHADAATIAALTEAVRDAGYDAAVTAPDKPREKERVDRDLVVARPRGSSASSRGEPVVAAGNLSGVVRFHQATRGAPPPREHRLGHDRRGRGA